MSGEGVKQGKSQFIEGRIALPETKAREVLAILNLFVGAETNICYDSLALRVQSKGNFMRLKARFINVLLYRIAIVALVWIGCGCGPKPAKLPTYMRPELLYLSDRPYSRLYVEVDTVEGVEVPDQWLEDLKSFLSNYCSKPNGIDFAVDEPVPFSQIKDMPIGPASVLCLDGPNARSEPQPAYLHVFFYDKETIFKKATKWPHVNGMCPSAIFYNLGYFRISKGKAEEFALQHELGHVLGLCKNPKHSDGMHCKNQACLMHKTPGLLPEFGLLFGSRIEKQLCADCQRDLERWKSEDAGSKLAFNGPFLIRREDGYSVASLPYCDLVIPAASEDEFDWRGALTAFKKMIKEEDYGEYWKKGTYRMRGQFRPDDTEALSEDMINYMDIFTRAAADPSPFVKRYAVAELERLKKEQD